MLGNHTKQGWSQVYRCALRNAAEVGESRYNALWKKAFSKVD
jgi:hypothetical protein